MTRVMIRLENDERDALLILSRREKRDARAQAALLIRAELERLGLLPREPLTCPPIFSQHVAIERVGLLPREPQTQDREEKSK